MCAKLRTVAASNNRDQALQSLYYCLFAPHICMVLFFTHISFVVNHNQRNATREVATTSPPFYNEPHRSHVLCVKAELGTTATSWSQHHFVAIRNPERHVRKASHRGSKQQQRSCSQSLLLLLARTTYIMVLFFTHIPFVVNHTINAAPLETLQEVVYTISYENFQL